MKHWALLALLTFIGGCASYQFDIVEPAELTRTVTADQPATISRPPLDYRLQTTEGRLVMSISNGGDQPIELSGERSYVVDPDGQSRPLRGQSIAPHSFIKLILPPLRPMYRTAPGWGIGFGVGYGWYRDDPWWPPYYDDGWYGGPAYLLVYDDADGQYWTWRSDSTARLRLSFKRDAETFDQEFTIRKRKK